MADLANFGNLTPRRGLWQQDDRESVGTKLHMASRELVLEEYRVGCFAPALIWPGGGVNFGILLSHYEDGLKQPILSPERLGKMAGPYLRVRAELGPAI